MGLFIKQNNQLVSIGATNKVGITPYGNQDIETLSEYDVTEKSTARVSDVERAKIIAGNIKKDVTILGVTGEYEGDSGYQLKYPYTATPSASYRYSKNFTQDTFGNPTTSTAYGAHSIHYLSTVDASIDISSYGRLYYFTSSTAAAILVPNDAGLYIKKGASYSMGSQPYQNTDPCVLQIGTYNNVSNIITIQKNGSSICQSNYSSGTPSNPSYEIYTLIGSTYRQVYLMSDNDFPSGDTRLSNTSIGSSSYSWTQGGTTYSYTLSSSDLSTTSESSLYWGNNQYQRTMVYPIRISSTGWGAQYICVYSNSYKIYKYL